MPKRVQEHRELGHLLERCLECADRLDLTVVAAKIAEALDQLHSAPVRHGDGA